MEKHQNITNQDLIQSETQLVSQPIQVSKTQKLSKNISLKLSPDVQELLQKQSEKYGIPPSIYIAILIKRNAEGADKKEFENVISMLKDYMLYI